MLSASNSSIAKKKKKKKEQKKKEKEKTRRNGRNGKVYEQIRSASSVSFSSLQDVRA
jgi:hypothetical protein